MQIFSLPTLAKEFSEEQGENRSKKTCKQFLNVLESLSVTEDDSEILEEAGATRWKESGSLNDHVE